MNNNKISRRDFIKTTTIGTVGIVSAGGLLSSIGCGKEDLSFAIPMSVMIPLGTTSYNETTSDYKISQHKEYRSWVENSGKRLRTATIDHEGNSKVDKFAWSFELFEDNTINAWCMPGARIAFYEGIMPLCKSETGVGIVMGHEIAHAVSNHSGKRMAQQLAVQLGITTLSVATERLLNPDPVIMNIAASVFGVGGTLGILAYSRKHEYEADKMGLIYAARAGYDPREAPLFWNRMSALGSSGPEFLSTHPSNENRIKELEAAIPEAMTYYNQYNNNQ
ncbi:MAG: M48 family metallopeptidase [Marinilabiliaceae bacterium]|nr:M48 family metallopeptidase [Marinilabiliaceae bacterium]